VLICRDIVAQKFPSRGYFGIPRFKLVRRQKLHYLLPHVAAYGSDLLSQVLSRNVRILLFMPLDLGMRLSEKASELRFLFIRKVEGLTESLQFGGYGI